MRRGGGLYGNFVSANDGMANKAYRGAEIPPPASLLQSSGRPVIPKVGGKPGITSAALELSKHGYSTMSSISDASLSYSQYGVAIKRARTEDEYFNSDDEPEEAPAYQPKPGSPGPGNRPGDDDDDEDDPLDAYMKSLEKQAKTKVFQGWIRHRRWPPSRRHLQRRSRTSAAETGSVRSRPA